MKSLRLIDIDLFPDRDALHSGLLLKENREIFMMLNFDKKKKFDGLSVFRSKDINSWRNWNAKELNALKVDNRQEFISKLDIDKMKTFYSCLKQIGESNLFSFFTDKNVNEYHVAQIKILTRTAMTLRLVDLNGKFTKIKKVKISDIDDFSFMTKYESKLRKNNYP